MQDTQESWVRKTPWSRKQQPPPVFLLGKCHRQWSLVGYSPWGPKESDMTEQPSACAHTHTGKTKIYQTDEMLEIRIAINNSGERNNIQSHKSWFLEKIDNVDKPLIPLTEKV